jgi:hypothetical protein
MRCRKTDCVGPLTNFLLQTKAGEEGPCPTARRRTAKSRRARAAMAAFAMSWRRTIHRVEKEIERRTFDDQLRLRYGICDCWIVTARRSA